MNNFFIKSIFAELKLILARKNAGLVRQLTELSNKSNTVLLKASHSDTKISGTQRGILKSFKNFSFPFVSFTRAVSL
jgi:hypothetical protein